MDYNARKTIQYGESYKKPLLLILTIFVGGVIYFSVEPSYDPIQMTIDLTTPINFEQALTRTINASLPYFGMPENANITDYILKLSILPLLGTLFIALKRKLERKTRH